MNRVQLGHGPTEETGPTQEIAERQTCRRRSSGQLGNARPRGNDESYRRIFFDSSSVETLIADYQASGELNKLGEIITRCKPIALSLIRSRWTMQHEDELMSIVNRKLLVSLPQYNRMRGTAFSFVSRLTVNMLATVVTHKRKLANRYTVLDDTLVATVPDESAAFNSTIALDDIVQRVRSITSSCSEEHERATQRWYTESFIDSGFEMRRHECADAAMKVYGLSHRRSRDLYDLTLLSIRQALWDETMHREIDPNRLAGTKARPLCRFQNFTTEAEFSKLVNLLRDLAPNLIILMRPRNEARIRRGEWDAIRENLLLVLNGDPLATPLYHLIY